MPLPGAERAWGIALGFSLLSACGGKTKPIYVHRSEILRHVLELRDAGSAEVETINGKTHTLKASDVFEVVGTSRVKAPLSTLLAHCPDLPPFAGDSYRRDQPCLMLEARNQRFLVGHETENADRGALKSAIIGGAALGTAGGLGYCAVACESSGARAISISGVLVVGGWLLGLAINDWVRN